jgi:hypothetical protein
MAEIPSANPFTTPHPATFMRTRLTLFRFLILSCLLAAPARLVAADICDLPQLSAARTLTLGNFIGSPRYFAAGDFNRDGLPDFAASTFSANTNILSVFLATAPGVFADPVHYPVGTQVHAVVAADFNGDGLVDLAASANGLVAVLPGKGDGTFEPAIITTTPVIPSWSGLAVADFDRDGKKDLAIKGAGSGLRVLFGNGDGTFTLSGPLDSSNSGGHFVAVLDANGDGFDDMVTANGPGTALRVILGNGNGTFQGAINITVPSGPMALAVGDFNGDGRPDLVSANNAAGNVSVLLGNGQGGFNNVTNIATGSAPFAVDVGDFNGNGRLDIAVVNQSGYSLSVILGAGDGTFTELIQHRVVNPVGLRAVDFDLDGVTDLLAGSTGMPRGPAIWLLRGRGDGRFQAAAQTVATGGTAQLPVAVDVNGDDQLDLVVMQNGSRTVAVLINQGDETFAGGEPVAFAGSLLNFTAADFNGDGKVDLAATITTGTAATSGMYVATGNGDGTFQPPVKIHDNDFFLSLSQDAATADVDGNGHPDILVTAGTMSGIGLTTFLNNGNGTFQAPVSFAPTGIGDPLVLADFNGDGRPDVVVANRSTNHFSLFLGNANGTFQAPLTNVMGVNVYAVTTADFNGDGHADVAVANFGCYQCGNDAPDGSVAVRLGNGNGTFQDAVHYGDVWRPHHLKAGDLNGDGIPDLVVTDLSLPRIVILSGVGDGTFGTPVYYALPAGAERFALADLNGDGKPDIVTSLSGNLGVGILWNVCEAAPPVFSFTAQPGQLRLTWPAVEGFELQATDDLGSPGWDADIPPPQLNDNQLEVTIPFDAPRRFFRLRRP